MNHMNQERKGDLIIKYLPIICIIISGIISFTNLKAEALEHGKRIEAHQSWLLEISKDVQDIKVSQARTEENVKFIVDVVKGNVKTGG